MAAGRERHPVRAQLLHPDRLEAGTPVKIVLSADRVVEDHRIDIFEAHPEQQWHAHIDKWAEWAKINVTLGFTGPIFWRVVRTAPKDQEPTAIRDAVARLDPILDIAETQLGRTACLAGDALTLADIQLGHVLYRYYDIAIAAGAAGAAALLRAADGAAGVSRTRHGVVRGAAGGLGAQQDRAHVDDAGEVEALALAAARRRSRRWRRRPTR